jgi:multicomponent K+:H+ antiporter subunit F
MTQLVIPYVVAMLFAAFGLALFRLLRGPSLPDRILALDTLYILVLALLVLLGIIFETVIYFEAALLIAMLGFVGTVALSKFLMRGDIIE